MKIKEKNNFNFIIYGYFYFTMLGFFNFNFVIHIGFLPYLVSVKPKITNISNEIYYDLQIIPLEKIETCSFSGLKFFAISFWSIPKGGTF